MQDVHDERGRELFRTEAAIRATMMHYFRALHDCDGEAFASMFHPQGRLLGIGPDGAVVCRGYEAFRAQALARGRSTEYSVHDNIVSVYTIDDTCATVKAQVVLPPDPNSPTPTAELTLYTDFMTLLWDDSLGGWRIISKVYSSAPLSTSAAAPARAKTTPADFAEAAAAVWDGYVSAGRACSSADMARFFHPACNLTFATPSEPLGTGGLAIISSDDFCAHVGTRWSSAKHARYAHLQDDPRASAQDCLLSLDFAGPGVARATLLIGYPPFLYHDVLLLLRLSAPVHGRAGWWIVAKSSSSTPLLADEAAPVPQSRRLG